LPAAGAPQRYRILDSEFHLRADPRVAPLIDAHIGHFGAAGRVTRRRGRRSRSPGRCRELAVFSTDGKWILTLDGRILGECAEETEVVPLVHANLGLLAYHESGCLAALHAAAVAREGRCVLLPAASGSGKSTLAAALAASGYDYCADDLAVLAAGTAGLRPVPFKLGLKQGSWRALERFCPAVTALPTFRRADGKLVRYWLPETALLAEPDATLAISAVVFPRFRSGAGTELRALARSDAFLRIAAAGYDLPGGLDRARVGDLVAWIRGVQCYELEYGDLDGAIAAFEAVLR
jgi:hypothetical protein